MRDSERAGRRAGDTSGQPGHSEGPKSSGRPTGGGGASRDAGGARSRRRKGGHPAARMIFIQVSGRSSDSWRTRGGDQYAGMVNIMDEEVDGTMGDWSSSRIRKLVGVVLSVSSLLGIAGWRCRSEMDSGRRRPAACSWRSRRRSEKTHGLHHESGRRGGGGARTRQRRRACSNSGNCLSSSATTNQ